MRRLRNRTKIGDELGGGGEWRSVATYSRAGEGKNAKVLA